jgi:hypothetical protein
MKEEIKQARQELVYEWNKLLLENKDISELNNKQILEMLYLHQFFITKCLSAIELLTDKDI